MIYNPPPFEAKLLLKFELIILKGESLIYTLPLVQLGQFMFFMTTATKVTFGQESKIVM